MAKEYIVKMSAEDTRHGNIISVENGVDNLGDLKELIHTFVRAMGFNYVEEVLLLKVKEDDYD